MVKAEYIALLVTLTVIPLLLMAKELKEKIDVDIYCDTVDVYCCQIL